MDQRRKQQYIKNDIYFDLYFFVILSSKPSLIVLIFQECLHCVVLLCQTTPKASDQFVDIVGGLLLTSSQETVLLLCQTLASFGSMKRGVLSLLLPEICNAINTVIESEVDTGMPKSHHYIYHFFSWNWIMRVFHDFFLPQDRRLQYWRY